MKYLQQTKVEKEIKLDLKDRKILELLSIDSRMSSNIMGKKVGLSRDSVRYRIKNMEKNGIIQGYRAIIDTNKFGYESYHVFIRLNQPNKNFEEDLIKKFNSYGFIRAVIKFTGKYDFELAIISKNIKEFDESLNKILGDCGKNLQDYEVMSIVKGYVANTLPNNFHKFEQKKEESFRKVKVDSKDKEILKILANDASLKFYDIAKMVKLSDDAVNYRIKNLIKSKIIVKFAPVINYNSLKYSIYAILLRINGLKDKKEEILNNFLKNDRNVLWAVKTIGRYNCLMYLCVQNTEELHKSLREIRNYLPEDILDYESLIAYEEYKFTYFPESIVF